MPNHLQYALVHHCKYRFIHPNIPLFHLNVVVINLWLHRCVFPLRLCINSIKLGDSRVVSKVIKLLVIMFSNVLGLNSVSYLQLFVCLGS